MGVYLLHSSVSLVRSNGEAVRHYLGWCSPGMFPRRFHEHETGRHSSKVVQAFLQKGGILSLGNYWPHLTRHDEARMKRNGHLSEKCMVCLLEEVTREWMAMTELAVSESEFDALLRERSSSGPPLPSGTTGPPGNGSLAPRRVPDRTWSSGTTRRVTRRVRRGTSNSAAPAPPNGHGSPSANTRR